jgi:ligand-binding sensor domain-containing protein
MSFCLPSKTTRRQRTLIALSLFAALSTCAAGQDKTPFTKLADQKPTVAKGETVLEMPKDLWRVFQAKDGRHWFASRTEGAFRHDGKAITRFSSKDGLPGDDVGGIQEDKQGNLYFSTDKGISKFDGRSFATLEPIAAGEWKNEPDDLWFPDVQDSGSVYRYDGESLHRLEFPKTKAGDKHFKEVARDKFPNAKYSPYDVYTIFKDSKGNLWFGTATLGACRYDGKSFAWLSEDELQHGSFGTRSIVEDKDGKFWFSSIRNRYEVDLRNAGEPRFKTLKGIRSANDPSKTPFGGVIFGALDNEGAIWMATYGEGVWRYDGKSVTHFPVTENGSAINLFSIYKDNQGVMWLGTQGHGAFKFNGKSFEKFRLPAQKLESR